jgi:predicted transposase/invertase (TIGR01784 family)
LIEIHFIEVSKFRKLKERNLAGDKLQRWLTFFEEDISEEELKELIEMDEDIKKAEEKIEYLSNDPYTLALYQAREKSLHDRANMVNSAKAEGLAEGLVVAKIQVANNLLKMGMDVPTIAKVTGLNETEIGALKDSNS